MKFNFRASKFRYPSGVISRFIHPDIASVEIN